MNSVRSSSEHLHQTYRVRTGSLLMSMVAAIKALRHLITKPTEMLTGTCTSSGLYSGSFCRDTLGIPRTALAKTTSTRRHQKLSGRCRLHTVKLSRLGSTVLRGGNSRSMIVRGRYTSEHSANVQHLGTIPADLGLEKRRKRPLITIPAQITC